MIRSNEAARQELQSLRSNLSGLQRNSADATRNYDTAARDMQSADSDLRDTQWPVQRASRDTVQTDVSSEGWELDRVLNSCDRELTQGDRELGYAAQTSRTIKSDVDTARQSFDRLRGHLSDRPDLLSDLERASGQLEDASREHKSADDQAYTADTRGDRAARDLQSCDNYVWRIRSDRVGTDVSSDARMLDSRLSNIKWDVRDAKTAADRAWTDERDANGAFTSCDQTLQLLQSKL